MIRLQLASACGIPLVDLSRGIVDGEEFTAFGVAVHESIVRALMMTARGDVHGILRGGPIVRHDVVGAGRVLGEHDGGGGIGDQPETPPGLWFAFVVIVGTQLEVDIQAVAPGCRAAVGWAAVELTEGRNWIRAVPGQNQSPQGRVRKSR